MNLPPTQNTPSTKQDNSAFENDQDVTLRCNRCGKSISPENAVLTPTGYRCQDCVRQQQKVFDSTTGFDIPAGFLISFAIAFAGSWLVPRTGFLTILIAPALGALIYNIIRWILKRRRSRALNRAVLWGAIVGSLPVIILQIVPSFLSGGGVLGGLISLLPLVWQIVYGALITSTAYAQFTGGNRRF